MFFNDFATLKYDIIVRNFECSTTLHSKTKARLSMQKFWYCYENAERTHQDDSNDTPQPIGECQVDFPLLWIKAYPGLS